ncbi:hypothetical protein C8R43DRAFT_871485, partial [Mycena crocata]
DTYLREKLNIASGTNVDLWTIPDDGSRPVAALETLIQLAIHSSESKKLTLQGIYAELIDRFAWYKQVKRGR